VKTREISITAMLLTITTTAPPATDLGYLLHKNPARFQSFDLAFGKAHIFYPEATEARCTAALLLAIDSIGLVRKRGGDRTLAEYVNDRPYVASSFMSVAIGSVFATAMGGRCKERPGLAMQPLPLQARLAVLPCRGGEAFLRRLFEPLGYGVEAIGHPLDDANPDWGPSPYFTLTLSSERRLSELLTHLYVLIPVLDDDKHYFVGDEEVQKLLRHGEGWLGSHPEREVIVNRYLRYQKGLARRALDQLTAEESPRIEEVEAEHDAEEVQLERPLSLNEQRIGAVLAALKACGARSILDLGCGEGNLLRALIKEKSFERVVGLDVSHRALETAHRRLGLERMPEAQRARIALMHGSLIYRDARIAGFDAAAVLEVIEHLDPARLNAFERCLFEFARPQTVVLTTPNAECNVKFLNLSPGRLRHKDHRFEWTRAGFEAWAHRIAESFGYQVRFLSIGPQDAALGAPTQMGVFARPV
jgi:3' terminal RNA ribose 2'-O-methyltransferase Hen1